MTAGRSIDHIVVATHDLDGLAARYEALGFTLTPRAFHEDRMGTSNRLALFAGLSFIELLEVDRPEEQMAHDLAASPPVYAFGWAARQFLSHREGMSALVVASDDARADLVDWRTAGLAAYAPFDFGRTATLPDGTQTQVAFSLAFTTSPRAPDLTFFACQNKFPENFWKSEFQTHANGATAIAAIHMVAETPSTLAPFLTGFLAGTARQEGETLVVEGAKGHHVHVHTPDALAAIDPTAPADLSYGALFAGVTLTRSALNGAAPDLVPAADAGGLFLQWAGAG
jgi:hypothetical protein